VDGTAGATLWVNIMYTKNQYHTLAELPAILTVADVQDVLRIGRNTAYQLCRSGKLRTIRVGNQLRCTKSALLEYLEADEADLTM